MVLTGALSSYGLGDKDLWSDEADTWYVISGGINHMWSVITAWDLNSAPYFMAMWFWARVDEGELWLRLPSAIAAVGAIPLIAVLGRKLFDRRVGLTAALFTSVSGGLLLHAQEARAYPLVFVLAIVASLLLLRAVRLDTGASWIAYAMCGIVLTMVHLLAGLALAGHTAWLLVVHPVGRPWVHRGTVVAGLVVTAVALPFGAAVHIQHTPDLLVVAGNVWSVHTYRGIARFWAGGSDMGLYATIVPFVAVGIVVVRSMRNGRTVGEASSEWFVVLGVLVPTAIVALASFDTSLLFHRYLFASAPCFIILTARGLQLLPKLLAAPLAIVVVLGSLSSGWSWLGGEPLDQFEALTHTLIDEAERGDRITFLDAYDRLGVAYYSRKISREDLPTLLTPEPLVTPGWRGEVDVTDPFDAAQDARTWVVVQVEEGEMVSNHATQVEEWARRGLRPSSVRSFGDHALLEFDVVDE